MTVTGERGPARRKRCCLNIQGTVQGVGFRPFLFRLAKAGGLAGFAVNTTRGVLVEVEGPANRIEDFIEALRHSAPPHSRVKRLEVSDIALQGDSGFQVRKSVRGGLLTVSIPADLSTCPECIDEIFDPSNRRYLYPFTNCTACGPRYSVIESVPYDRACTSMRHFEMCARCAEEYDDPSDRRFHAEPNACPDCGPQLSLFNGRGLKLAHRHAALLAAAEAIRKGCIVAVKGVGGFHLVVDARNEDAVLLLRERKHRPDKAFAVMYPSVEDVKRDCHLGSAEERLLTGPERPIVLVRRKVDQHMITSAVAPGNPYLGVMVPYSPLHHILMTELGFPVVATSGNRADEPIVVDNEDVFERLNGIADLFLVHDRLIVRPLDDSVARIVGGQPMLLRRARGYAPVPVAVAGCVPDILALGGHLKSTIAISDANCITLSQQGGDLGCAKARDSFDGAVEDLTCLHDARPRVVACDLHPDYYSTYRAQSMGLPVVRVQHHAAHIAAVMAERGVEPPVLGVAWDGSGWGPDGTIWGGEFLQITDAGWRRVAHLRPFRLPGGEAAMREPRRAGFGLLDEMFRGDTEASSALSPVAEFSFAERRVLCAMLAGQVNSPLTTSAGRLFDAVASLLGLCQQASYEGQAACALEWAVGNVCSSAYDFPLTATADDGANSHWVIDWEPAVRQILKDMRGAVEVSKVSSSFHSGLALAIAEVAKKVGERKVVLSGGCFQNAVLLERTIEALSLGGFEVHWPLNVPPNDGGLALGQAWWASRRTTWEAGSCV